MSASPSILPHILVEVHRVAQICGLEAADIYRAHTRTMGSPGHFVYPLNATGQSYTLEGLCELVDGLTAAGHSAAAALLRTELGRLRLGRGVWNGGRSAIGVVHKPGGWMAEHEQRQEGEKV